MTPPEQINWEKLFEMTLEDELEMRRILGISPKDVGDRLEGPLE